MTPLRILIVEDVVVTAMDLRQTLERAGHTITGIARTLQTALNSAITNPPDLALVDIELEKESTGNGIDTAKELLLHNPMPIIYLTANSERTMFQEAQQTQPSAYLLKPFKAAELLFNVELAYQNFRARLLAPIDAPLPKYLLLPIGKELARIDFDDVVYLEADGAYAKVFMIDKIVYTVSTNLGQLEPYFQPINFFRLSRFHIPNLNYINGIKDNELLLDHGRVALPIPANKRKELFRRLTIVRTKKPPENGH